MTKALMLLRHGKSDWRVPVSDIHRPLKKRGKREAQRIGAWLHSQNLRPDAILHSSALRASTTAEKCAKAMGLSKAQLQTDARLYEASTNTLLNLIAQLGPQHQRVLLVAHNPGLEALMQRLLGDACPCFEEGKILPTASLAHLVLPLENWHELTSVSLSNSPRPIAHLRHHVRGRDLPAKFPYPLPNGAQPAAHIRHSLRDRPAYYYSQSSVIPYRINQGKLEVLVIGSSSGKRCVVPKGIIEPGLSAIESAKKEALEEAGIEGRVSKRVLGEYCLNKWGASCTVQVYAMQVERILPEASWPERHRGRRWLPLEQAMYALSEHKLQACLAVLQGRLDTPPSEHKPV